MREFFEPWVPIATVLGFLFSVIGLFLSASAIRKNTRQLACNLVSNILSNFNTNEYLRDAYYQLIEYNGFKFFEMNFRGSEVEKKVDGLLSIFSPAALYVKDGMIKIDQLEPLAYYLYRIMGNAEIQKYLSHLRDGVLKGKSGHPFLQLKEVYNKMKNNY
jgi:hypothetical protein